MRVKNFDEGKVIELVHGYPPALADWSDDDIRRAAAHVWEKIRPQTREEHAAMVRQAIGSGQMEKSFENHMVAILQHGQKESLKLITGETSERLQLPQRFEDGRIVIFDLRMQNEEEVAQAFIKAQQQEPQAAS